jgi:hypothetical protein
MKPCPRTGVVNVYSDADPFLSIGSVIKSGAPQGYLWRCYVGERPNSGIADNLGAAGRSLVRHYREWVKAEERAARSRRPRDAGRACDPELRML